jgi:hypothetical protein
MQEWLTTVFLPQTGKQGHAVIDKARRRPPGQCPDATVSHPYSGKCP